MECPNCKTSNPNGNRFCGACGVALTEEVVDVQAFIRDEFPRQIERAIDAKLVALTDREAIEVKATEQVIDRTWKWLTRFATVIGIPIFVGSAVLGFFGYSSFALIEETRKNMEGEYNKVVKMSNDMTTLHNGTIRISGEIKMLRDSTDIYVKKLKEDTVEYVTELRDSAVKDVTELKEDTVKDVAELKDSTVKDVIDLKEDTVKDVTELREDTVKKMNDKLETADETIEEAKDLQADQSEILEEIVGKINKVETEFGVVRAEFDIVPGVVHVPRRRAGQ